MKKGIWKKIFIGLAAIIVLIQFFRPTKNLGEAHTENDITNVVTVPPEVMKILETSCYDCHSDHTNYPWYSNIQPIAWWLQDHVIEGKKELNFSQFKTYKPKRQQHKFEEIAELVQKRAMPLKSYLYIHHDAELSDEQIKLVSDWATAQHVYGGGGGYKNGR